MHTLKIKLHIWTYDIKSSLIHLLSVYWPVCLAVLLSVEQCPLKASWYRTNDFSICTCIQFLKILSHQVCSFNLEVWSKRQRKHFRKTKTAWLQQCVCLHMAATHQKKKKKKETKRKGTRTKSLVHKKHTKNPSTCALFLWQHKNWNSDYNVGTHKKQKIEPLWLPSGKNHFQFRTPWHAHVMG